MSVLIFGKQEDEHVGRVTEHLSKWGEDYFVLANADVLGLGLEESPRTKFLWQFSEYGKESGSLDNGSKASFALEDVKSVWYRRPAHARLNETVAALPAQLAFSSKISIRESARGLNGIICGLSCCFVNHPWRQEVVLHKLAQLKVASTVGFRVPDTMVTNSPESAAEFFDRHEGQVVYKLIDEGSQHLLPRLEWPRGIPTLPLRRADLPHLKQVQKTLHLFQNKIEKSFDLRVTVIGTQIFAALIKSQQGAGVIDWRLDQGVEIVPFELPEEDRNKCIKLCREFGLNYAALDFAITKEAELVFFELNPAGQFLFVEEKLGQGLSQELAALLSGRSEPLVF